MNSYCEKYNITSTGNRTRICIPCEHPKPLGDRGDSNFWRIQVKSNFTTKNYDIRISTSYK